MDYRKAIAGALLLCAAKAMASASLLIENVTPIDPVTGRLPVQDVLTRDGHIVAMGDLRLEDLNSPDGTVEVIDGSDRYLIPGLWDMHVHLTYEPRLSNVMGELFLDYGITSVRDTGGILETLLPVVETMEQQGPDAPRVFFSGPLLDGTPTVYDGIGGREIGVGSATPEAANETFEALLEAGVDFIKIYELVTPEVFQTLVEAAREHDLPIAAHVPLSMLASQAGPQVQSLEHLRNLELDCAANADALLRNRRQALATPGDNTGMALRASIYEAQRHIAIDQEDSERCQRVISSLRDTVQVPTLRLNALTQYPPFEAEGWDAALERLPEALAAQWRNAPEYMDRSRFRRHGEWSLAMAGRLSEAGVPIGAGTDTPIGWAVPGYSLHRELEILVATGLSPQQALAAATVVPARFFGLRKTMGRIASGYVADLLLLTANPLENIANTRSLHAVIARGIQVR